MLVTGALCQSLGTSLESDCQQSYTTLAWSFCHDMLVAHWLTCSPKQSNPACCLPGAGVQPVSPAGEAPTPAAAAAAELERLPSSSEQDAQPQSPPTAAAPAAAETKAAAAAGDKAAKRRKLLCIAVPLLMIFLGLGVGLGVGLGTRRQQQLAAVPERLTFSVTVEAPTSNSAVSCAKWFGTRQVSKSVINICIVPLLLWYIRHVRIASV